MRCPICLHRDAKVVSHSTRDASVVDCPQCNTFIISGAAQVNLANYEGKDRWKFSAWLAQYRPSIVTAAEIATACSSGVPLWFGEEVIPLWIEAIEPAIRLAGYEPLRIDSKQHNGRIDEEIMASIRGARFVIADFTGNRGGVYYEAGFAHGLGLPVIFMCRDGDELHFDVRQYNCIFWKLTQLLVARDRVKNRILATLGQGPLQTQ